jgi:hypothetical protein
LAFRDGLLSWIRDAPSGLCAICGNPKPTARHRYCVSCGRKRPALYSRRGRYGLTHKKRRKELERLVSAGAARCTRCGLPIAPGSAWHLDHADDGGYAGAAHAYCNTTAGNRARGRTRPPFHVDYQNPRW